MLLKKWTKYGMFDQSKNQSRPSDHWPRSQNLGHRYISDILPIYLRYFTDIFLEFPAHARVMYTLDISLKYQYFLIFRRNIGDFLDILSNQLSVSNIMSIPADIRYFGDISADISDFLFID